MNITKTELPTRPFTVKKFKLECEGNIYYLIQGEHWFHIWATIDVWDTALSSVFIPSIYTKRTNDYMIRLWHAEHPTQEQYYPKGVTVVKRESL